MWKWVIAFLLFIALGFWLLLKGGDQIDLGGEKHEVPSEPAKAPKQAEAKP